MFYLYRITDHINNKVYIGQSIQPNVRWSNHKSDARNGKPIQYIHRAMAKYGIENFSFEVIASCRTQEDADETEDALIIQYDSRNKKFGYNLAIGGSHGGHSEETKQKQREATLQQIAIKGHPAQGTKRTEEQRANLSAAQRTSTKVLNKEAVYTPEVRQKMSESHIGKVLPQEQRKKMAEGIQAWWDKRNAERFATGEIYCHASGCEVSGKAQYYIVNGTRYCTKHGGRLKRTGKLELNAK